MTEWKPVRVAFVGVEVDRNLLQTAAEYEVEIKILATHNGELKRELQDFSPDVVVAANAFISSVYANIPQDNRPSIIVAAAEGIKEFPTTLDAGIADDLILLPIRTFDFLNRLRWHQHLHALRSVEGLNSSVANLVQKLEEDIVFAQKIQRRLIKDRFPAISGLNIKSKYWCGLRSGGDYFDIFEFSDKNHVGFLLTDASSYQLSATFLHAMIHLPTRLEMSEMVDPLQMVKKLFQEVDQEIGENEELSIFYGVLDRKNYILKFVSFGRVFAHLRLANGGVRWLSRGEKESLHAKSGNAILREHVKEVALEPEDRLYLISDGWEESLPQALTDFLSQVDVEDPQSVINEFAFALRSKQDTKDSAADDIPMPPQDCSIMLIDVAKNILRLARG